MTFCSESFVLKFDQLCVDFLKSFGWGGGGGCVFCSKLVLAGTSFFSSHSAKLGLHVTHTEEPTDVQARFHELHKCDRM